MTVVISKTLNATDWAEKSLAEVASPQKFAIVDGPFGTQLHADEYKNDGVPLIRITNLSFEGRFLAEDLIYIAEQKAKQLARSKVMPGDLMIAKTGATIGKCALFPKTLKHGIVASSCLKISFDETKADSEFFLYLFVSPDGQKQIINGAGGSTRTTINITPFKSIRFKIPQSSKEQSKIAEVLSTLDDAIKQTDNLIEKYKRIKQGMMQDLFLYGIDEKGQIRSEKTHEFKDSPLGRIPEEWAVVKFTCEYGISVNPDKLKKSATTTIRYIDIDSIDDFRISKTQTFSLKDAPSRAQRVIRKNDTIISTVRPYLKAFSFIGDIHDGYICSTGFAVIRVVDTNKFAPEFIYHYTLNDNYFMKQILPLMSGSNYPAINATAIKDFLLLMPSLHEQWMISNALSSIDATIEKETATKNKLLALKRGLMDDLLTGKVRVTALLGKC